jgi:hypothetical protein
VAVAESLPLEVWQNFYVIVGSSAGALIGLTFIVITIAADANDIAPNAVARLRGLRAFITPTVVHFGVALWVAALLSMPGHSALTLAVGLAGTGALSTLYCANVIRLIMEMRMRGTYQPFLSDWIWSAVLPLCAYMSLLAAAFLLRAHARVALDIVAMTTLLLLLLGLHNAWDGVVWMRIERHTRKQASQREPPSSDHGR